MGHSGNDLEMVEGVSVLSLGMSLITTELNQIKV